MNPQDGRAPRGVVGFLIGFAMAALGAYLVTNQVTMDTGYYYGWNPIYFGWAFVPLFVGLVVLFFDAHLKVGWWLTIVGAVVIVGVILFSLRGHFRPTTLSYLLFMLGLLAGGLGLMAASLRRDAAR